MTIYSTGANDLPVIAERNRNSMMLQAGLLGPMHVWDGVHSGMAITKTTGMGFTIGPGRAAINAVNPTDGTLTAVITADEVGAFEPNPTGADRYDLVVLKAYPANPSETGVKLEVIAGVPGTNPGYSSMLPAGAIALYGVVITAGMSAANGGWNPARITDRRRKVGIPEFTAYTPTFVGWDNLGSNPGIWGKYRIDGNKCSVHVSMTGGVGASMGETGTLAFTLPFPAKSGFVYNGMGSLHHPNVTGLAFDLRILSSDNMAMMWKPNADGALIQPGLKLPYNYPWTQGTVLFCSLEYDVEEAVYLSGFNGG